MKSLLFSLGFFLLNPAFAQVVFQDTLYINADNKVINKAQAAEAHSYLVRKLNENNQFHGDIIRYYANGQVYEQYTFVNGKKESDFAIYTESGQPLLKGKFRNGQKTGLEKKWFPNGQLQYEVEYVGYGVQPRQKVINEWSKEGRQLIRDGTGFVTLNYPDKGYFEEGNYENGFKQGEWFGTYIPSGKRYFIESYSNGELIGGTSFDHMGNDYDYTVVSSESSFKGGIDGWQTYLKDHMKYPRKQMRKRMQADVPVSFVIEKDGSLSNIAILKTTLPDFDNEALRLLNESPSWVPATFRGQKVKSRFQTLIQFKLRFDERGNPLTDQQHRHINY